MSGLPGDVVPRDNFLNPQAPSGSGRLEVLIARQQELLRELDAVNNEIAEIKNGGIKKQPIRVMFAQPFASQPSAGRPFGASSGRMDDAEFEQRFGMARPTITMCEEVSPEELSAAFGRK